jgi:3-oxoacyl-[acyl-carrier-protein] synthase-3
MKVAADMLNAGTYRRILICTAELASRGRNFDEPESAALLGDGAAAVIVEATTASEPRESANGHSARVSALHHFAMQTWSTGIDMAEVRGGGIWRRPDSPATTQADNLFHMEGERLLRSVAPKLRRFLKQFFADAGIRQEDVDLVVPHQPSGPGLQMLPRIGFPEEKIVNIVAKYGNCVAASIPMALAIAERDNRVRRGDRVLILGTAAGVSIGGALLTW